jgi:hypothetical protein
MAVLGERAQVVSGRSITDWAKTTGKLVLKTVADVSDVFPPLKSVAVGLNIIVDRIEVSYEICVWFYHIVLKGGVCYSCQEIIVLISKTFQVELRNWQRC